MLVRSVLVSFEKFTNVISYYDLLVCFRPVEYQPGATVARVEGSP